MVLIRNGLKYACELCVRGHRTSSCDHSNRPLVLIKPKGRPSTNCSHCKDLRKNRNVNPSGHCLCAKLDQLGQKNDGCTCIHGDICKCHTNRKRNNKQNPKISTTDEVPVNLDASAYLVDVKLEDPFAEMNINDTTNSVSDVPIDLNLYDNIAFASPELFTPTDLLFVDEQVQSNSSKPNHLLTSNSNEASTAELRTGKQYSSANYLDSDDLNALLTSSLDPGLGFSSEREHFNGFSNSFGRTGKLTPD